MVRHAIILAGGSGTRLWPASIGSCPKQFLALGREYTLFQQTLLRVLGLGIEGDVLIVANKSFVGRLQEEIGSCLNSRYPDPGSVSGSVPFAEYGKWPRQIVILPEPQARNTAPALVYACRYLQLNGEEESSVLVLPSDHYIEPLTAFRAGVEQAAALATENYLVSFGIPPRGPETGYGYLETGDTLPPNGYKIKLFHEKPDLQRAREYIQRGNFFWNAGIFCFKVSTLLTQAGQYAPLVLAPFKSWTRHQEEPTGSLAGGRLNLVVASEKAVQSAFEQVPSISIDYAIMEKTTSAAMVESGFRWSDVGSWDEVAQLAEPEGSGTGGGTSDPHISYEAENCFIHSDIPVALAGVKDLIVIVKNGRVLVCPRGNSQVVSKLVKEMKEKGREELI